MHSAACALFTLQPVSPVRDEGESLAYFEIGKFDLSGVLNNDSSLEVQLALASVCVDDVRTHSNLAVKRSVADMVMSNRNTSNMNVCILASQKISNVI